MPNNVIPLQNLNPNLDQEERQEIINLTTVPRRSDSLNRSSDESVFFCSLFFAISFVLIVFAYWAGKDSCK